MSNENITFFCAFLILADLGQGKEIVLHIHKEGDERYGRRLAKTQVAPRNGVRG